MVCTFCMLKLCMFCMLRKGVPGSKAPATCILPNQQATARAFAALLADGDVVTWGDRAYGGSSTRVQEHLCHVRCQNPEKTGKGRSVAGYFRIGVGDVGAISGFFWMDDEY